MLGDTGEIIRQEWDAVSASPATLAALAASISALVALMATAITPFVSIAIAKKQIRANVISTNRQAWINALRDDLAELFELAISHFYLRDRTLAGEEGFKYGYEQRTRLRRLESRIRMRLNPDEIASQELLAIIKRVRTLSVAKDSAKGDAFEQALEDGTVKAQQILRTECRRVKQAAEGAHHNSRNSTKHPLPESRGLLRDKTAWQALRGRRDDSAFLRRWSGLDVRRKSWKSSKSGRSLNLLSIVFIR